MGIEWVLGDIKSLLNIKWSVKLIADCMDRSID